LILIISATLAVNSRNPIQTLVHLIIVYACASGFLLLIHAEFLALSYAIIYVGAIAVLILFAIIFLQAQRLDLKETTTVYLPINAILMILLTIQISFVLINTNKAPLNINKFTNWINLIDTMSDIQVIATTMYLFHGFSVISAAILLQIAMIGCCFILESNLKIK